jgi:hypothetical protein
MSNLSNNTMISKLFVNNNYNTVVKQDFAVVVSWWVGGAHDWHKSAPELAEHPPYHILDPSLDQLSICVKYTTVKTMLRTHAQGGL